MSILQEIHAWSKDLALWQQDAIARLYADRTLSAADLDDLYALAKSEAGIADPEDRKPSRLVDAQVVAGANRSEDVRITAIKDVSNVNALAPGAHLPIARTGITAIYGENGVGKSGYSRIFKKACRARDRREPILPNAFLAPEKSGPARAIFEVEIEGKVLEVLWQDGLDAPEALADIAIFDTHCARAYIDNQGDFAYSPYGLDILEGLVGACNRLKSRAMSEKASITPNTSALAFLTSQKTAVSTLLLNIPGKTTSQDVEALALMTQAELDRLSVLNLALAEVDPQQKAQGLRHKASRFKSLALRIATAIGGVSDESIGSLRTLVTKASTAINAAELASAAFKSDSNHLAGTGGDEWKALFDAAKVFIEQNHPEHSLSQLPPNTPCPLCQNELGEIGAARLLRFERFVSGATEQAAKDAREAAANSVRQLQQAALDLMFRDALLDEVATLHPQVAEACSQLQLALKARQLYALQAAMGKAQWEDLPALSVDPQPQLQTIINSLEAQSAALQATADDKLKAAMLSEQMELESRRRLSEVKDAVHDAIAKYALCEQLQTCIDGMEARGISRKSTELSRTIASQELADALNTELKHLKVHHLNVVMKPESPGGKTQFKLALQLPGGGTPAAILSEGEQRAIAIASFMAELRLGKGQGGIVLDDPVSSLDHRRRWEVAERLAIESLQRQVIVFTHDIYFLLILEQKAREVNTTVKKNYIRRTPAGYGVHSDDLPFDVLGTKDRIGRLRVMLAAIRKAENEGDEELHRQLTARCYGHLRLAWERCIEEVLLNGVVQRFGEGVSTQRLKGVTVTDADYVEIEAGMSKASKFEHDASAAIGRLPVPAPDELSEDIERLSRWRESLTKRVEGIAKGTTNRAALFGF